MSNIRSCPLILACGLIFWLMANVALAQQLPPATVPVDERLEPTPRLIFEDQLFNAGEISPGPITHEFKFTNSGTAPLIIKEIQTGCGCLAADYDQTVPPGGQGRVKVTLQVYPEWAGHELRRTVWVMTNDPLSTQARLTISAQILPGQIAPAK